jgi:hypothetical protein
MKKTTKVSTVKTLTVNGIPYSVNEKEVYMYGTSVRVGLLDGGKVVPQGSLDTYLAEYRTGLKAKTLTAMENAKKQFEGTA